MKFWVLVGACAALLGAACSNGVPLGPSNPTTTTTTTTTTPTASPTPAPAPTATAPTPAPPATVAYTQDIAPILNSDCLPCHNDRSAAGRYSVSTYAAVMRAVTPGSTSSALVLVTRPGGLMYGFLTGDRTAKSSLISQWVVSGPRQSR